MSIEDDDKIFKLKLALDDCSYIPSKKESMANDIMRVLNYKKKIKEATFFVKTKNMDKIIMVCFPMSIEFNNKNYNVPINIFFPINYPYEAPELFLEEIKGCRLNSHNYDVNPYTKQIMTFSLKYWSYDTKIECILDEIYNSFKNTFPMYKESIKSPVYPIFSFEKKNDNCKEKLDIEHKISEIKYNKFNDYDIYKISNVFNNIEISENDDEIDYSCMNNILCSCPNCGSFIEILNETYNKIEFKCPLCNKNDEKGVKTMFIEDYLLSLPNNKCNICKNGKEDLKLCTKCKLIICNDCINNHIEQSQDKCSKDFFINYKEIGFKCLEHPDKVNLCFCDNCQRHLCSKCLKSKEHKNHIKTDFIEIKPSEKEISKFSSIIELLQEVKKNIKQVQIDKVKEARYNASNQEFNILKSFQGKISKINSDMKKEIEDEKKKLREECDKLYQEYLDNVESKINNLKKKVKEINGKYENLFNEEKNTYEKNIDELNNKIMEEYQDLCKKDFPIQIKLLNNLIKINEIFYHSFLVYENNYYANINFDKIITFLDKNIEILKEIRNGNINLQLNDKDLIVINSLDDGHSNKNSESQEKKE